MVVAWRLVCYRSPPFTSLKLSHYVAPPSVLITRGTSISVLFNVKLEERFVFETDFPWLSRTTTIAELSFARFVHHPERAKVNARIFGWQWVFGVKFKTWPKTPQHRTAFHCRRGFTLSQFSTLHYTSRPRHVTVTSAMPCTTSRARSISRLVMSISHHS